VSALCPYCSDEVEPVGPNASFCTSCGTPHHQDCWEENGGCTVFGCPAAPAEELKIHVTNPDLETIGVPYGTSTVIEPPTLPPPFPSRQQPYQFSFGGYNPAAIPPGLAGATYMTQPRSRTTFIMLGVFLGVFGVHNFYAGYTGKGRAQLCLTLLSFFFLSPVTFIWALVEICIVDSDKRHVPMN
jgi:hypothetical protein